MTALDSFYPMTGVTEQLAQWLKFAPYYFGDGVVAGGLNVFNGTQHAPPGMSVDIASGRCFIQGVFGENGTAKTVTIAAADATNPRIDRIVLRLDTVANDLELLVLTGTAAVSPAAPALVRSATQTDYSLYQVLVGTTVTSIVTANLTDEREFASMRGIPLPGRLVVSSGTINPYKGPTALTEGWLCAQVSGTATIANIALSPNAPVQAGAVLLLFFGSAGAGVSASGNVGLVRPFTSGGAGAILGLLWDGGVWQEISRSGEQAPTHQYYGNPTGTVAAATFASIVAADLPTYGTLTLGTTAFAQAAVTPTFTTTYSRYAQFGKMVNWQGSILFTGSGTAGNAIVMTIPAALTLPALAPNGMCVGSFIYYNAGTRYVGNIEPQSTTTVKFMVHNATDGIGATPNVAIANNHQLYFTVITEIA